MKNRELLIKGGTVVDPSQGVNDTLDVLVREGLIAGVGAKLSSKGADVFDAGGMLVMPGLIDMHVHLREPGFEEAETILSGCEAAAAGGFTTVCPMPNTEPATDDAGRVRYILERAEHAKARVLPIGAITKGRAGEELVEMADMVRAGAGGFSDDGVSVLNSSVMLNALRYADMVGKPIIAHEEDPYLANGGYMNESALSAELGLRGMPRIAEETIIMRDIAIAEYTKTALHVTHISTRGTVSIIRRAKARGIRVTCDVTPHHLTLTEDLVASYDTRYKMNPPLRTADDIEALREGLADGTVDAIATDHAPHSLEYKEREFIYAPFGVTGLETALGVIHRELVKKGVMSWEEVVVKLSSSPANILGIEGGTLRAGTPGDITIYDPGHTWTVDPSRMKSRSGNTAYFGWELPGWVAATVVGGVLHVNE